MDSRQDEDEDGADEADEDEADEDDAELDDAELDDAELDGADEGAETDEDVQQALEHMADATGRLDLAAIEAMLTQSRDLTDDLDEEEVTVEDEDVQQALDFFDAPSGPWDVQELLGQDEER